MTSAPVLPVGIVVPTLNAMAHLRQHVERLRELAPRVEEVVVVDSHSTDGTQEFLQRHLTWPNARHLSHPPGLYASWNFGLSQLRSRFAYIATVGDAVPPATLERMAALAECHAADVVLTPPTLRAADGQVTDARWPIHDFIRQQGLTAPADVPGWKAFVWTAFTVPAGLMGSSASNLYRTELLQRHPFPIDFGYHGDTAWLLENALGLRIVVAPDLASEFLVHPSSGRARGVSDTPRRVLLSRLARATWQSALRSGGPADMPSGCREALERFWDGMEAWLALHEDWQRYRASSPVWWLKAGAWRVRARRRRAMAALKQTAQDALVQLPRPPGTGRGPARDSTTP